MNSTPPTADAREQIGTLLGDALTEAYTAGATAVHDEWLKEGTLPRGDPEFYEAASDYATLTLDPLWSKSNVDIAAILALPGITDGAMVERLREVLEPFARSNLLTGREAEDRVVLMPLYPRNIRAIQQFLGVTHKYLGARK